MPPWGVCVCVMMTSKSKAEILDHSHGNCICLGSHGGDNMILSEINWSQPTEMAQRVKELLLQD